MPVPKRKRSRARRDKRFANKGIEVKPFTYCSQCKDPILPHQACKKCGFYKGAKVLTTKSERGLKRAVTKQAKAKQQPSVQSEPEATE